MRTLLIPRFLPLFLPTIPEYASIEFKDLKTLATVGIGGFGRVLLVKYTKDNALKIFALKQMKKVHILETMQQEHVFNERRIMLSCEFPLIHPLSLPRIFHCFCFVLRPEKAGELKWKNDLFPQRSNYIFFPSIILSLPIFSQCKCHLHLFVAFIARTVTQSSFICCWKLVWGERCGRF